LIQDKVGLCLKDNQMGFLEKRLWKRMNHLSINDYGVYYNLITEGNGSGNEWGLLVELIVNCESGFFRDVPTFDALMDRVLPELVREISQRGDQWLSMWSAGCSRGQEAYSLAMAFAHLYGDEGDIRLRVIGTDISLNALARAIKGEYSSAEIRNLHPSFRDKYMTHMKNANNYRSLNGHEDGAFTKHLVRYRVKDEIRKHVQFEFMNLNKPSYRWVFLQDVIFCQNVLIYFDLQDRARTILMLLRQLKPSGYLFLASGENMGLKVRGADIIRFEEILAYKRNKEAIDVQIVQ
jgi:chemotaxis methyl-accepting protein methylase